MTSLKIEQTARPRRPYSQHVSPAARQPRRLGPAAIFRRLTSPAAALLLAIPSIGYYVLAVYVNVVLPEGSVGGIIIRAFSLALLILAYVIISRRETRQFGAFLLPVSIFFLLYTYRLLENMVFLDLEISPGNAIVLVTFVFSGIVPAYLFSRMERTLRDEDMVWLLSLLAILFVIGIVLNRDALSETADTRAMLDKVNPIALAYVASSLSLYYMLRFTSSKRTMIEALLIVPILLVIVSLARSRGMLISTGVTLLFYVLALKGTRRIWTIVGLGGVVAVLGLSANPEYFGYVMDALSRIGEDRSSAERVVTLGGAWHQFLADPIFGKYAVELQLNFYPHNIYLESLMAVGLIGTIPFMLHFGMAVRAAFGLVREPEPSFTRVFVALLFIRDAIAAATSGALWGVSGFWITSLLVITMWFGRKNDMRLLHLRELRLARRPQPKPVKAVAL